MSSTFDSVASGRGGQSGCMHKELFGVFGARDVLADIRSLDAFDDVVAGDRVTVGVRDTSLGMTNRTDRYSDDSGLCLVFGEAYSPDQTPNAAEWLLNAYATDGLDAFSRLNGSYLAVVEHDGSVCVGGDPIRSWECFYSDSAGYRTFGTDPVAVRSAIDRTAIDRTSMLEFLHVGTVLGDRTMFEEMRRVPFDGYLTETEVDTFDRFVYDPQAFDYVEELADRLQRAILRRGDTPSPKGLLLSGGRDSRVFMSLLDIDYTYTIGDPTGREVRVAAKVADQYDAEHEVFKPDERYLLADDSKVRYSQGIKESLHIHHAGYADELDVETIYHGVLFDTLLKGYFIERDGIELFGSRLPSNRLSPNPNPIQWLIDTLGFFPSESPRIEAAASDVFPDVDLHLDDPEAFVRDRLRAELRTCWDRAESTHNAMDLLVLKNQPVLPFRTHLADNYVESFVAIDRELLDWHLKTPPEYRNDRLFWSALKRIDPTIFRHKPPSQPRSSVRLNEIERFIRKIVPMLEPFESAWPDRGQVYDEYDIGEKLFPSDTSVRRLSSRLQLRVNDARWWLS